MKFQNIFLVLSLLVPTSGVMAMCSGASTTSCSGSASSSNNCSANTSCGACHSIFIPRSQASNTAMYGYLPFAHIYDMDQIYGGFDMNLGYQQSFAGKDIAKCMFGTSTLSFKGSQVAGRTSDDLIADYFGLPTDYVGTLSLKPSIKNFNINVAGFVGFDEWVQGLFLRLDLIFGHQRRSLESGCPCDTLITQTGSADFPKCYMDGVATPAIHDIKTALSGQRTFGQMGTAWQYGQFSFCDRTANKVASIDIDFGYDFLRNEAYHLGAFVRASAPTGTKIDNNYAKYVFNPVVGNGHHWELGGGLDGHWEMWNCDDNQTVTAYLHGYITHLFENNQVRSFDFNLSGANQIKCLSRYMLLKELTPTDSSAADFMSAHNLINGINYTTRNARVSVAVKGDATLRFVYRNANWDLGFGYNIYGHSTDSICIRPRVPACSTLDRSAYYGFKGCSGTCYRQYAVANDVITGENAAVALNATQNANAFSCGVVDNAAPVTDTATTFNVAWDSNANNADIVVGASVVDLAAAANYDNATISNPSIAYSVATEPAKYLDAKSGASPRQLTQKGFVTFSYTWMDCDWSPYLGAGVEAEGGTRNCDLKQWGINIKGGVSY